MGRDTSCKAREGIYEQKEKKAKAAQGHNPELMKASRILAEYAQARHIRQKREDAWEEGRKEGIKKGS